MPRDGSLWEVRELPGCPPRKKAPAACVCGDRGSETLLRTSATQRLELRVRRRAGVRREEARRAAGRREDALRVVWRGLVLRRGDGLRVEALRATLRPLVRRDVGLRDVLRRARVVVAFRVPGLLRELVTVLRARDVVVGLNALTVEAATRQAPLNFRAASFPLLIQVRTVDSETRKRRATCFVLIQRPCGADVAVDVLRAVLLRARPRPAVLREAADFRVAEALRVLTAILFSLSFFETAGTIKKLPLPTTCFLISGAFPVLLYDFSENGGDFLTVSRQFRAGEAPLMSPFCTRLLLPVMLLLGPARPSPAVGSPVQEEGAGAVQWRIARSAKQRFRLDYESSRRLEPLDASGEPIHSRPDAENVRRLSAELELVWTRVNDDGALGHLEILSLREVEAAGWSARELSRPRLRPAVALRRGDRPAIELRWRSSDHQALLRHTGRRRDAVEATTRLLEEALGFLLLHFPRVPARPGNRWHAFSETDLENDVRVRTTLELEALVRDAGAAGSPAPQVEGSIRHEVLSGAPPLEGHPGLFPGTIKWTHDPELGFPRYLETRSVTRIPIPQRQLPVVTTLTYRLLLRVGDPASFPEVDGRARSPEKR